MNIAIARPLAARRRFLAGALAVTAVAGLGWGAAFTAGTLYGRASASSVAAKPAGGTTAPRTPVAPADAGHGGGAAPASGPAAPAGGGAGGGH